MTYKTEKDFKNLKDLKEYRAYLQGYKDGVEFCQSVVKRGGQMKWDGGKFNG